MKKENGKIIVAAVQKRKFANDQERLEHYLAELRTFNHNEAADFFERRMKDLEAQVYLWQNY